MTINIENINRRDINSQKFETDEATQHRDNFKSIVS